MTDKVSMKAEREKKKKVTGPGCRWRRLGLPLFMMAGISILSGSAGVDTGGVTFPGMDKVAHFLVFGLLGIAWARVPGKETARIVRLVMAVALVGGFGLIDEAHQLHNPARQFEWADLLADLAGALGLGGAYLYCRPFRDLMELDFRYGQRLRRDGN
ncbi:MAG TPA: VanZ family protein [Oceanipulchritudo sp.]|nr:VanZ family protein [Oceanipulchritudo sp.]